MKHPDCVVLRSLDWSELTSDSFTFRSIRDGQKDPEDLYRFHLNTAVVPLVICSGP